jgi:protein-glutamine gamma-glutamyltransferase
LRYSGIPARLVNGFRTGEFNSLGDSFTVRQYDAHSWVEAWFEPYGWIEFDPTPPDPQRPKPTLWRMISNLTDAVGLWWWEGVVNYDVGKQFRLIKSARQGFASLRENLSRRLDALLAESNQSFARLNFRGPFIRWFLGIGMAVILAAGALLFMARRGAVRWSLLRRRLLGYITRVDQRDLVAGFYRDALDLMRRHGFRREPGQTPLEFANSLQPEPGGAAFLGLTILYNRIRFGSSVRSDDVHQAGELLKLLGSSLRHFRK